MTTGYLSEWTGQDAGLSSNRSNARQTSWPAAVALTGVPASLIAASRILDTYDGGAAAEAGDASPAGLPLAAFPAAGGGAVVPLAPGGAAGGGNPLIATSAGTVRLRGSVTGPAVSWGRPEATPAGHQVTVTAVWPVINDASIFARAPGALVFADGVTGSAPATGGGVAADGTSGVANNQTITLDARATPNQTIAFSGSIATVQITSPKSFGGTVTGLVGHDIIDLVGLIADHTTYNSGTGLVQVYNGGTLLLSFTETGLSAPLNTASDGNGGTVLTQEQSGTEAQMINVLLNGSPTGQQHNFPTGSTTITYSFASTSTPNWTATEQAAFIHGLKLWGAMANINFAPAAQGQTGQIVFVRGASGSGAYTSWSWSGNHITTSATISIDTGPSYWADLSTFGLYGWMTLLHEEGHAIALLHPGNYNGSASIGTQQTYFTDTWQYTVMSYFDSKYTGANWVSGGKQYYAESPMLFDIAAMQQVYGANTTLLHGGDTFGFHASAVITGNSQLAVYNFSTNQPPVVTIWDGGANNTLDLSGFAAASYVSLLPGTFSNVDGMTDNVAIAYNTAINTAIGGTGNDTFVVNGGPDTIDGGGGSNIVVFNGASTGFTEVFNAGTVTVTPVSGGPSDTLVHIQSLQFTDKVVAACYLCGTRIATPGGGVRIETLSAGDPVCTAGGAIAAVKWIGYRDVDCRRHPRAADLWPVRVRPGAFGAGRPHADLWLSPDHAVFIDGVLIPIRYLLNGRTIAQERRDTVSYWHVELARHDVILAEGLPCESYLDTGNRGAFANGGPAMHLHPDFALRIWQRDARAPLVAAGAELQAARSFLLEQATLLGHAMTDAPDLHLHAAGHDLRPLVEGRLHRFQVPAKARSVHLRSRSAAPALLRDDGTDERQLGVAVSRLAYDGEEIALSDPRLGPGWHPPEPDAPWRWTNGAAALTLAGGGWLEVEIALTALYWRDEPAVVAVAV